MKIIELDDPVKIIMAKQDIENKLIEEGKLEYYTKHDQFILSLKLQETIYVKENAVIPFKIYSDEYLFTLGKKEDINELVSVLEEMKYDLSLLKEISIMEVYLGELTKHPTYFIVNSKYMIYK